MNEPPVISFEGHNTPEQQKKLIEDANHVLEWLKNVSHDELFAELAKCDCSIGYAIDHTLFDDDHIGEDDPDDEEVA